MTFQRNPAKVISVEVLDYSGQILATSDSKNDVSITKFQYEFDDEEPDTCKIFLRTSKIKYLDALPIGRGKELYIRWGYSTNPKTNYATVKIRDHETNHASNGITSTLICSDLATFISNTRSDQSGDISIIDYIIENFYGKYRVIIKDANKSVWAMDLVNLSDLEKIQLIAVEDMPPIDPFYIADSFYEAPEGARYVREPEKGSGSFHWYQSGALKEYLEKDRVVSGSNRSIKTYLMDVMRNAPKGPWYITTRGKTLLIHNRDFVNRPIRLYEYEKDSSYKENLNYGEDGLISFKAKTKYDNFEKNTVTHEFYDPDKKSFYSYETYLDELFSMAHFNDKFNDKKVSNKEFEEWFNSWLDLMKAYEKWGATATPFTAYIYDGEVKQIFLKEENQLYGKSPFYKELKKDNISNEGYVPPYYRKGYDEVTDDLYMRGTIYSVPIEGYSTNERNNFIENEARALEMDKEEATIIVEGDPVLQTGMRVQINNVFRQHAGLYYIKKCKHDITNMGYKTTMECLKVLSTNRLRTAGAVKKAVEDERGNIDAVYDKQYAKEQKLFGNPIILVKSAEIQVTGSPTVPGATSYTRTITDKVVKNPIQETASREQFVETIVQLRSQENLEARVNVEDN